jgi:hypothetical protein
VRRAPYRLPCTVAARIAEAFPGDEVRRLEPLLAAPAAAERADPVAHLVRDCSASDLATDPAAAV